MPRVKEPKGLDTNALAEIVHQSRGMQGCLPRPRFSPLTIKAVASMLKRTLLFGKDSFRSTSTIAQPTPSPTQIATVNATHSSGATIR